MRIRVLTRAALIIGAAAALAIPLGCQGLDDLPDPSGFDRHDGPVAWPMRGVNYVTWWPDGYTSSEAEAALSDLPKTGTNWVALVVSQYMGSLTSDAIAPGPKTPSDASVVSAVRQIQELRTPAGEPLRVLLKPHVEVEGESKTEIDAGDAGAWFDSYRQFIRHYAHIAEECGVDMLCLATELSRMTEPEHEDEWRRTVAAVREAYRGPLTLATNWDHLDVGFWDALDGPAGVDAYFPLTDESDPSYEDFRTGWLAYSGLGTGGRPHRWMEELRDWQARHGKPVLFTEIGARSAMRPEGHQGSLGDAVSQGAQARYYRAAIDTWADCPWLQGMLAWSWEVYPAPEWPDEPGWPVHGKLAQDVLCAAFGGYAPPGEDPGRFGFERSRSFWRIQEYEDSRGVTALEWSQERAYAGTGCLKLSVDLRGGDPGLSKGEIFIDLRYNAPPGASPGRQGGSAGSPLDLAGVRVSARVFCPVGSAGAGYRPNGLQLFAKSGEEWRSFYGPWHNITAESGWSEVSLVPSAAAAPGGWMDAGFDPTQVVALGLKVAIGEGSNSTFRGAFLVDHFDW